jgi:hypothetical protein
MQSNRNRGIASGGPRRTALCGIALLLLAALACASSARVRSRRPHSALAAARTSSALCATTPPAASPRFAFPFDPAGCACTSTDHGPGYGDLECACASGSCPRNVEDGLDLVLHACATDKAARASRSDGCGRIVLSTESGSCRIELSYDAASALLIGGSSRCDVAGASPPSCEDSMQSGFEVGAKAECDAWDKCTICGEDGSVPACDSGRRCGL